jgi:hypothetical protein
MVKCVVGRGNPPNFLGILGKSVDGRKDSDYPSGSLLRALFQASGDPKPDISSRIPSTFGQIH